MKNKFNITTFIIILIFSLLGLYASFILTTEKIETLKVLDYVPPCSINAVINCASVMKSPQAEVFGFPNSLMGLIGYSAVAMFAVMYLFGARTIKLFYVLVNLGALTAFGFSYWLLYESVFKIGALCPWCILSCLAATSIFFAITLFNLKENNFSFKENIHNKISKFVNKGYWITVIIAWYVLILTIIYIKYHETLFG